MTSSATGSPKMELRSSDSARATASNATVQSGDPSAASRSACSVAIAFFSQEKGFTTAFEDVFNLIPALIHGSNVPENRMLSVGRKNEDTLCLPENGDVWVVGHKD